MKRSMMVTCWLLIALFALVVTGCGDKQDAPVAPTEIGATVDMQPQQPKVNQETDFRVTLTEPDGKGKLEQAKVSLFLEMEEMDHGENQVALTEVEPGVYQGKGSFPMNGVWIAYIRAEKGGETRTARVELQVQ